jgi:uncharacterized protein YwqG
MKKDEIIEFIKMKINQSESLKSLLSPCLSFNLSQNLLKNKENYSKIGGSPDLFNKEWPIINNHFLTFLGQISLNQINELNNILPKNGMLYFFILTTDIGYRYPDKKGEFRVVYIEDPKQQAFYNNEFKKNLDTQINEFAINFYENYTFPSYQESIIERNNITTSELEIIDDIENEIRYSLENDYDIEHQLLGHPKAVQGTVRFWWAMNYLEIEQKEQFSKEEISKIHEEEENFILLLQLNFSDPKINFDYFGDSIVYFGIHKNDLQNKNFENVVLTIQNT